MNPAYRFSKSKYDTVVRKCSWLGKAIYVDKIPREFSQAAYNGSRVHELWTDTCLGNGGYSEAMSRADNPDIAEKLHKAILSDVYFQRRHRFQYERFVALRSNGELSSATGIDHTTGELIGGEGDEIAVMILDREGPVPGWHLTEDLKTTMAGYEKSDPVEVIAYICAAKALYPRRKKFRFEYNFCMANKRMGFEFEIRRDRWMWPAQKLDLGTFKGNTICFLSKPIWANIQQWQQEIQAALENPEPTPGDHCIHFYGKPCQLLGNGCPLGDKVVDLVIEGQGKDPLLLPDTLTRNRIGVAFMTVLAQAQSKIDLPIPKAMRSDAYQAVLQLKQAVAKVERILHKGGPIQIGDSIHGYVSKPTLEIDERKALAIKMMLDAGGIDAVAKGVNIGKTSVKRLGKRAYGELGQRILDVCAEEKEGTPKWGLVSKEITEAIDDQD